MKRIFLYAILAAIAYYLFKIFVLDQMMYRQYLKDIGIPDTILKRMTPEEIRAAAIYLKRYAKTNRHFSNEDKDYDILAAIRTKYGIFT